MNKTWLKHIILDECVRIFFDNLITSFSTPNEYVLVVNGSDMNESHVGMKVYGMLRYTRFGHKPIQVNAEAYVIKDNRGETVPTLNSKICTKCGDDHFAIQPVLNRDIYFLVAYD